MDRANEYGIHNRSPAIFDEDGTYVAYDASPGVSIGSWRPTGERSVEVVFVTQRVAARDLFAPDRVPGGTALEPDREVWRLTLTLDEEGATMTSVGGYELLGGDGVQIMGDGPWAMEWTRLVPDATAARATPTP
jgi:hypothetical protein